MDTEKLLAELEGAGVDVSSLREHTGGFTKALESFVAPLDKKEELEAAQAEADKFKAEAETNFKRMQNKDTSLTEKDNRIKQLEAQLAANTPAISDTDSAVTAALDAMREEMGGKIGSLVDKLEAQERENQRLAAEIKWNQTVEDLAKEFPVLDDRQLKQLVPKTTDENVLRESAELLTKFNQRTQEHAYQQVREGYVPPTAPPRVTPGDESSFQREMVRVNDMLDSGEITPQQAQTEMNKLARMMKPES